MTVVIKITPENYQTLRKHIVPDSPAYDAVETAARIEYAVEGVLFAGYNIVCSEAQARSILDTARRHCPAAVFEIEKALHAPRQP
jgi:hypothetical protein